MAKITNAEFKEVQQLYENRRELETLIDGIKQRRFTMALCVFSDNYPHKLYTDDHKTPRFNGRQMVVERCNSMVLKYLQDQLNETNKRLAGFVKDEP